MKDSIPTKISVVIPTYNAARYLGAAIDSVLAQGRDDVEIIVVDDGSSDDTTAIVQAYTGQIVYIEQENQGVAGARNTGIAAATGQYIAFLDADDLYYPGALDRLARYLDEHPDSGLVCADIMAFDEDGDRGLISITNGKPKYPSNFRWEADTYNAHTNTVMVRREVFDTVGGFEQQLRNSGEDWMMWVIIARRFNMAYIDEPLARYRLHGENLSMRRDDIDVGNRLACKLVVEADTFREYPASMRARLLYFRFATAWRVEPKTKALGYIWRAFWTDPRQIGYLWKVVGEALQNRQARRQETPA